MRTETATDVKNKFGEIVDIALREPVVIQRSGRNTVVMLAYEDYTKLVALSEDHCWGEKANKIAKGDFLSVQESDTLMKKILDDSTH